MPNEPTTEASNQPSQATACGSYPAAVCSSQFNGQLFDLPTDYYAVFSVRGKGKKAKTTFVCNVKARGKSHAIKIARSHGLDLPPMSHAHFIGLAGYRESLSWAFPMMNPAVTGDSEAGVRCRGVVLPPDSENQSERK